MTIGTKVSRITMHLLGKMKYHSRMRLLNWDSPGSQTLPVPGYQISANSFMRMLRPEPAAALEITYQAALIIHRGALQES